MCNDHELILGYVYGELPEAERRACDAHLVRCAACRNEVATLRETRAHLASWTPPEPEFGFRIVRERQATASRRSWFAPAWGFAAAAVLVLAAAAAIANIEIRSDASGFVIRTGWAPDATGASQTGIAEVSTTPGQWRSEMTALDARLRELERAASARDAAGNQLAAAPRMSDAEIIRRVREMLVQSEGRQQRELALQIANVVNAVDTARRLDYQRISQGMGQLRGQTTADVNHQLNSFLVRVSQQK